MILAAGASTRMGQPKQLLEFQGESLLERIVKTALATECRPVVVVLGAFYDEIIAKLGNWEIGKSTIVRNENWQQGMSSSVKEGLEALLAIQPNLEAVLLLLADQPFVTTTYLLKLLPTANRQLPTIVASFYQNRLGVPALFPQKYFAELLQLSGDEGARKLLQLYKTEVHAIPFPEGALDVDTPEEYEFLITQFE